MPVSANFLPPSARILSDIFSLFDHHQLRFSERPKVLDSSLWAPHDFVLLQDLDNHLCEPNQSANKLLQIARASSCGLLEPRQLRHTFAAFTRSSLDRQSKSRLRSLRRFSSLVAPLAAAESGAAPASLARAAGTMCALEYRQY